MRRGLPTIILWIGAFTFKDYEIENAEPLVTASPLVSRLHDKLAHRNSRDSSGSRR